MCPRWTLLPGSRDRVEIWGDRGKAGPWDRDGCPVGVALSPALFSAGSSHTEGHCCPVSQTDKLRLRGNHVFRATQHVSRSLKLTACLILLSEVS